MAEAGPWARPRDFDSWVANEKFSVVSSSVRSSVRTGHRLSNHPINSVTTFAVIVKKPSLISQPLTMMEKRIV